MIFVYEYLLKNIIVFIFIIDVGLEKATCKFQKLLPCIQNLKIFWCKPFSRWSSDKSLGLKGLLPMWSQIRTLWLLIWWLLETYIVVNFRACEISRDTRKLIRTLTLIIIIIIIIIIKECFGVAQTEVVTLLVDHDFFGIVQLIYNSRLIFIFFGIVNS
jgi:hypothetical protein